MSGFVLKVGIMYLKKKHTVSYCSITCKILYLRLTSLLSFFKNIRVFGITKYIHVQYVFEQVSFRYERFVKLCAIHLIIVMVASEKNVNGKPYKKISYE
jgi:hypothetical protein